MFTFYGGEKRLNSLKTPSSQGPVSTFHCCVWPWVQWINGAELPSPEPLLITWICFQMMHQVFWGKKKEKRLWDLLSLTVLPTGGCPGYRVRTRTEEKLPHFPGLSAQCLYPYSLSRVRSCGKFWGEERCLTQAVCWFLFEFHCVVQAGLKLETLLPQSPWC